MKTLFIAIALAAFMASSALAQPIYQPSYECGPAQYDSSGTPVAQYCDR